MRFIHYDEAKKAAISLVEGRLKGEPRIERALLVADLFGKLRLVVWAPRVALEDHREGLEGELSQGCGPWWTGEILLLAEAGEADRPLWEGAWGEARSDPDLPRLRVLSRHRTRTAWFVEVEEPLWRAPDNGPPVVVFYSFKGGLGRSTTVAAFGIQRARAGQRVCVVDFDLDAPGVGRLLAADETGLSSPWGVVDYLLERAHGEVPLGDYFHACARVAGGGEIAVFPAGRLDGEYADKLARVDLEERPRSAMSAVVHLLEDIKKTLDPHWILLDARAGVSEAAGHLLSGLAHLHVLFGTNSEQTWQGLTVLVDRLGGRQVLANRPQAEILLVQAMVPPTPDASRRATASFAERTRRKFTDLYYAEAPDDPTDPAAGRFWDVRDLDSADAPHVPVAITYDQRLADYRDIAEIADLLFESTEYAAVAARILGHFEKEPEA